MGGSSEARDPITHGISHFVRNDEENKKALSGKKYIEIKMMMGVAAIAPTTTPTTLAAVSMSTRKPFEKLGP